MKTIIPWFHVVTLTLGLAFALSCGGGQTPSPEASASKDSAAANPEVKNNQVPPSPQPKTGTTVIAETEESEPFPPADSSAAGPSSSPEPKSKGKKKKVMDNKSFDTPLVTMADGAVQANEIVFSTRNLPAISSDGDEVVVDYQTEDGARGNLNLRLITLAVKTGRVTHEEAVLLPDEYDDMAYGDDPEIKTALVDKVKKRLDKANAYLARQKWVPMDNVVIDYTREDRTDANEEPPPQEIHVAGFSVSWVQPRLTIKDEGDKVVESREFREWLARQHCVDPEDVGPKSPKCKKLCVNHSFINQAAVDIEKTVLLVRVAYMGTDICWEPDGEYHVIRLK